MYRVACQASGVVDIVKHMTDVVREVGGTAEMARRAESNVREVTRVLMALHREGAGELARIVGISRASMYERLNGKRPFEIGEVAVIADHYKISPAAFMAGPDALISETARAGSVTVRKPTAVRHLTEPNAPVRRPALSLVAA